ESLSRVHELRHEYDAILIGVGTALVDDPMLTDRSQLKRRRPLVRVVLDRRLDLSPDSQLAGSANEFPVLVFTGSEVDQEKFEELGRCGVEIVQLSDNSPATWLAELNARSLQGVLIEGGSQVAGQLFDVALVDKVSFFVAPKIIGGVLAKSAVGG